MELLVEEAGGVDIGLFYIQCPFDLSELDVPPLGPYADRPSATRASEYIVEAIAGNSE